MAGSAVPQPSGFSFHISRVGPTPFHLITTATALRLGDFLRLHFINHRHHLGFLLHSSFKNIFPLNHMPQSKEVWHERALQFEGFNFLQWSYDACATTCSSCLFFYSGEESPNNFGNKGKSHLDTSRKVSFSRRRWTNVIIAMNVLIYLAQIVTRGKLLVWGSKINSLIDKGQLWRLATSSFLHANIIHLMVNCFSLNSIGPAVETISGPSRYIAVYITSGITSSAMSYWLCKASSVGASGAIFGLIGSFAIFLLRHRSLVEDGMGHLQHLAHVIVLNMAIGLMCKGIDSWGHVGGLVGGVAASWLLGPAWKSVSLSGDGRRVFVDGAPIFSLVNPRKTPR